MVRFFKSLPGMTNSVLAALVRAYQNQHSGLCWSMVFLSIFRTLVLTRAMCNVMQLHEQIKRQQRVSGLVHCFICPSRQYFSLSEHSFLHITMPSPSFCRQKLSLTRFSPISLQQDCR